MSNKFETTTINHINYVKFLFIEHKLINKLRKISFFIKNF